MGQLLSSVKNSEQKNKKAKITQIIILLYAKLPTHCAAFGCVLV